MAESMPIINPNNAELHRFLQGKVAAMQTDAEMHELLKPYIVPEDEMEEESEIPTDAPVIGTTADVAYQIRQINQAIQDAEGYRRQAEEAKAFYERRIEALESRAEFLKENVGRWLKANGMQKLSTHSGTIYFAKRTKVTLPDDETLVRFASEQDPGHQFNLTVEKPNKTELKKYIASTGRAPEGYMEEKVEAVAIRKVA